MEVTLTSKKTNRVIKASYTARQILNFMDEDELVLDMCQCDCQPVGETNVVECNCEAEWEDYKLSFEDE
ncbi:acetyltransferase [Bacillus cereus group sp. TH152-1LC]|uniref:acetyltransferase n=1 Tax=Bacillus cereus group sp. TH152-1LC TaxID=3018060 RepID=UPI0022E49A02|nr:acetyltransferase [Bacillus cereus group sp. TH152-1LC]MDA1675127.1 acetyltransferase [Bacillus cereus group sp. TH152-1LC]